MKKVSSVPVTEKEFHLETGVTLSKFHLRKKPCPTETKGKTEIISRNTEMWSFSISH